MTKKLLSSTLLAGVLAISCIGISSGLRVNANAEEQPFEQAGQIESSFEQSGQVATNSTAITTIAAPTVVGWIGYSMTAATWYPGTSSGSNDSPYVRVSESNVYTGSVWYAIGEPYQPFTECSFNGSKLIYQYGQTWNADGVHSPTTSIAGKYEYTKNAAYSHTSDEQVISTSYNLKWAHGGSYGETLHVDILYNSIMKTVKLDIPLLVGSNETFVTINGVTFTVKTGSLNVYVKASKTVACNSQSGFQMSFFCDNNPYDYVPEQF